MATTCTCLNLRKASRAVTQRYDDALLPCGVRSTQLPVLITLALTSTTTVTSLSQELLMDRTSLARLLKPLEAHGYIHVQPGDDRRTREVSLNVHGWDTVKIAIPLWESAQGEVIRLLTPMR